MLVGETWIFCQATIFHDPLPVFQLWFVEHLPGQRGRRSQNPQSLAVTPGSFE